MDALCLLVIEHDLHPHDIEEIALHAGSNILNPIRYTTATNELEAKFCMPFLLSAIAIARKAGVEEFSAEFVNAPQVQSLMQRTRTVFDPEIEARGWDKIRSRLEVQLKDGRKLVREADESYRGGPDNPLSTDTLQAKFADCTARLLDADRREAVFKTVAAIEQLERIDTLVELLQPVD